MTTKQKQKPKKSAGLTLLDSASELAQAVDALAGSAQKLQEKRRAHQKSSKGLSLGPAAKAEKTKPRKAWALSQARNMARLEDGEQFLPVNKRAALKTKIMDEFGVSETTALRDIRAALRELNMKP